MPDTDPVEQFISSVTAREFGVEVPGTVEQAAEPSGPAVQLANCGHEMPGDGAKFCPECGSSLSGTPPPVTSRLSTELAARVESYRPKPEAMLTDEEKAERNRQHQAAVAAGKRDVPLVFDLPPEGTETFLIHFVQDGFYAFGNTWYRGQELEVPIGSARWHEGWETGTKWLQWQDAEQMKKCGQVYFRRGPWPGERSYAKAAGKFERLKQIGGNGDVTGPSVEELLRADKMEASRRRGVPRVSA